MRVLQVSNMVSHHQLPLSKELLNIVGKDNFVFAAMQEADQDRAKLGWDVSIDEDWIIRPSLNVADMEAFEKCWDEFDVVICGERLFDKMLERVKNNKLCFYMSERWWKPPLGKLRLLSPSFLKMMLQIRQLSKSPYFHYLPIGPFAAQDMRLLSGNKLSMLNWGYFTSLNSQVYNKSHDFGALKVLWAGRMLALKRVDMIIEAVSTLQKKGIDVELNLIGEGPEAKKIKRMAEELLSEDTYSIRPPISANEIPFIMAEHNIYVLTSNEYEGWGAVINEAMSVGCTVVASSGVGAAASMINDGVNGVLFKTNDVEELTSSILKLSTDRLSCKNIGLKSKETIEMLWSPVVAAERLVRVSNNIYANRSLDSFTSGPMASDWGKTNK